MTREEAEKVLQTVLRHTHIDCNYEYDDPVELVPGQDIADALEIALLALREQEQRRWIPVTERLPEFGERVLCTDGVAVFEQYRAELSCVYGMWERFGMKSPMQEVTHWMPLPEPPKEDAP